MNSPFRTAKRRHQTASRCFLLYSISTALKNKLQYRGHNSWNSDLSGCLTKHRISKIFFVFLMLPLIQVLSKVLHFQIRLRCSTRRETRECLCPKGGQHFETDPGNASIPNPLRYRFIICVTCWTLILYAA